RATDELDGNKRRAAARLVGPAGRRRYCLLQQGAFLLFVLLDDAGGGHLVAGLELQQTDALGGAAGLADLPRVNADDLAVVADQHGFRFLVHQQDAHHFAVARSSLDVDDALAAARLQAVFVHLGALAVAVFGDGKDQVGVLFGSLCRLAFGVSFAVSLGAGSLFYFGLRAEGDRRLARLGSHGHADDVIVFVQVHAAHSVRGAAHGAHILFVEADAHAFLRGQEDDLVAVGHAGVHQFVIFINADGDDAARHHVAEVLERGLLDRAVAGGEENVLALFLQVAAFQHGAHALARLQSHQVADVLALAGGAYVRHLVHLEPVNPPGVGEDEDVGVSGGDEQVLDEILVAGAHAHAPGAAAALLAIGGDGGALEIAGVADGDRHLLIGDQVFQLDFRGFVLDFSAARVAVIL